MSEKTGTIYTVGHSNYKFDTFLEIILAHGIQIIVDVRSAPYSKYCPQFNKEVIEKPLLSKGIKYLFLGKELGARPSDSNRYIHGRVSFDLLKDSGEFREGISRLKEGVKKNCVLALMCSEKDPISCHRTILISRVLNDEGVQVNHILSDSECCNQTDIEEKLQKKFKLEPLLFDTENAAADRIKEAYEQQEKLITHIQENEGSEIGSEYQPRQQVHFVYHWIC